MEGAAQTQDQYTDQVLLLGICSDSNSSFMRGSAAAPPLIRSALHSPSSNLTSETGVSFDGHPRFRDIGDWEIGEDRDAFLKIAEDVQALVEQGGLPLILGGDHALTYPVVQGLARKHQPLSLLHFDAHSDVYQEMDGNPLSHASPFARIKAPILGADIVEYNPRHDHHTLTAMVAAKLLKEIGAMMLLNAS